MAAASCWRRRISSGGRRGRGGRRGWPRKAPLALVDLANEALVDLANEAAGWWEGEEGSGEKERRKRRVREGSRERGERK